VGVPKKNPLGIFGYVPGCLNPAGSSRVRNGEGVQKYPPRQPTVWSSVAASQQHFWCNVIIAWQANDIFWPFFCCPLWRDFQWKQWEIRPRCLATVQEN